MTHNVRAGVQMNRSDVTEQQVYSGGVRYQVTNGVPTQAQVANPAEYTAETKTAGLWVEDEINMFQRLTIQPGVRYDWTKSISPDSNVITGNDLIEAGTPIVTYYTFPTTGATTPGLGTLYTWHTLSPRVGANLKLTDDGRTVLRGTIGRYYRPSFNSDFLSATPGLPTVTTLRCVVCGVAGTDPRTVAYPTVASVGESDGERQDLAGHEGTGPRTASRLASIARSGAIWGSASAWRTSAGTISWAGPTSAPPMERR